MVGVWRKIQIYRGFYNQTELRRDRSCASLADDFVTQATQTLSTCRQNRSAHGPQVSHYRRKIVTERNSAPPRAIEASRLIKREVALRKSSKS
jgi:hypothetical protein